MVACARCLEILAHSTRARVTSNYSYSNSVNTYINGWCIHGNQMYEVPLHQKGVWSGGVQNQPHQQILRVVGAKTGDSIKDTVPIPQITNIAETYNGWQQNSNAFKTIKCYWINCSKSRGQVFWSHFSTSYPNFLTRYLMARLSMALSGSRFREIRIPLKHFVIFVEPTIGSHNHNADHLILYARYSVIMKSARYSVIRNIHTKFIVIKIGLGKFITYRILPCISRPCR